MSTGNFVVDIKIKRCMLNTMKETMKRTNIYLSKGQGEKLKERSKDLGLSVAEIVRRAVDIYLKRS